METIFQTKQCGELLSFSEKPIDPHWIQLHHLIGYCKKEKAFISKFICDQKCNPKQKSNGKLDDFLK